MAKLVSPVRVPLFLELDIEAGPLETLDPGETVLPLRVSGGRMVTEDGTVLGEIRFDGQ